MLRGWPILFALFVGRDWLDYWTFWILVATLIGIVVYVFLTHRLSLEAERQNRYNLMPILVLDWPSPESEPGDTPSVENIGRGPAFNIEIVPIVHKGVRVEFPKSPKLALLQNGHRITPLMLINEINQGTGRIKVGHDPSIGSLARFIVEEGFPSPFTVTVRYEDVSRHRYQTRFEIAYNQILGVFDVTFGGAGGL
jgi:hypothetical protein